MVIFDRKSSRNNAFLVGFWSKTTVVSSLNLIKFNKTPAFYLRGYGNINILKSLIPICDQNIKNLGVKYVWV